MVIQERFLNRILEAKSIAELEPIWNEIVELCDHPVFGILEQQYYTRYSELGFDEPCDTDYTPTPKQKKSRSSKTRATSAMPEIDQGLDLIKSAVNKAIAKEKAKRKALHKELITMKKKFELELHNRELVIRDLNANIANLSDELAKKEQEDLNQEANSLIAIGSVSASINAMIAQLGNAKKGLDLRKQELEDKAELRKRQANLDLGLACSGCQLGIGETNSHNEEVYLSSTRCGHLVCQECEVQCQMENIRHQIKVFCPMCRSESSPTEIRRLYL